MRYTENTATGNAGAIGVGMTFGAAVRTSLSKCATFTGRASRSEFWWFGLFLWLAEAAMLVAIGLLFLGLFLVLRDNQRSFTAILINGLNWFSLFNNVAIIVLLLAVAVRRLHDIGRSGWWLFLAPVPLGFLVVIYWLAQPSAPDTNAHGVSPLHTTG